MGKDEDGEAVDETDRGCSEKSYMHQIPSAKCRHGLKRLPTVRKVLRRGVKVVRLLEVGELPLVLEAGKGRRIRLRGGPIRPLDVQASVLEAVRGRVGDSGGHVEVEAGCGWGGVGVVRIN